MNGSYAARWYCHSVHGPLNKPVLSRPEWLPAPPYMPLGKRDGRLDWDMGHLNDAYDEVRAWLGARYSRFEQGGTREVYDAGAIVYKIDGSADRCNEREAMCDQDRDGFARGVPVAPCRMIYHANGLGILIMQAVNPARDIANLPEWALRVDNVQIGYTPYGELVAFDVGARPFERVPGFQHQEKHLQKTVAFMQQHETPTRFQLP